MQVENEMGVIVTFAQQAKEAGFEIVSIRAEYPDAIVRRNGQEYRTEFEFRAKNFITHGHDPRQCDLIICWQNDSPDSVLSVIALSEPDWNQVEIILPDEFVRELAYWKYRTMRAEFKLRSLEKRLAREGADEEQSYLELPPVACPDCGATFARIQGLNAHKRHCLGSSPEEPELTEVATNGRVN